jgi:1,4-dihydroxy-2-naphthoate octaprenyltransferase
MASIGLGNFLAASYGKFNWIIFSFSILTTLFLQILSNLANDYGDTMNGADSASRKGPLRAVQSGNISASAMRKAMYITSALSFLSGVTLLFFSGVFGELTIFLFFLFLGILSIVAAVKYTSGKNPYGYAGFGDLAVFIFFGLVGVCGAFYLQTKEMSLDILLPAAACGIFATGVLNINNIRDIISDKEAGKYSIPVRLGDTKARVYHLVLLSSGIVLSLTYTFLHYNSPLQFLFLLSIPFFVYNGLQVWRNKENFRLDPYLKQMALSTLLWMFTFGIGILLAN